jgi:hypothetical protein
MVPISLGSLIESFSKAIQANDLNCSSICQTNKPGKLCINFLSQAFDIADTRTNTRPPEAGYGETRAGDLGLFSSVKYIRDDPSIILLFYQDRSGLGLSCIFNNIESLSIKSVKILDLTRYLSRVYVTMAGKVRQPINVEALEDYLHLRVPEIELPIELKQVSE